MGDLLGNKAWELAGLTVGLVVVGAAALADEVAGGAGGRPDEGEAPPALTADELLEEGEAAFSAGDFPAAESRFAQFLADYGENPQAAAAADRVKPLLALALVRLKKWEGVGSLIDECLGLPSLAPAQRDELAFWKGAAALQTGDPDAAQRAFGEYYADESHDTARRFEALLLFASADIREGRFGKAAEFLGAQMPKLEDESRSLAARARVLQLHAASENGDRGAALEALKEAFARSDEIPQLVTLQLLALKLGSRLLDEGDAYGAITCLQRVWGRDRLLRHQRGRLVALEDQVEAWEARNEQAASAFRARADLKRMRRELESFEAMEDFDAALRLRLATAFRALGRPREAALVLEDMLERLPASELVEQASVSLVQSWMEVGRWQDAVAAAGRYAEKFAGTGLDTNAATVAFLRAESIKETGDLAAAGAAFDGVVAGFPKAPLVPRAEFARAIVSLMDDANDDAAARFRAFRGARAGHALAEDALYWEGMAYSFGGAHGRSRDHLAGYLEKYPEGKYAADAVFRRAFASHAMAGYATAIEEFRAFLGDYPGSALADEARLLLGDGLFAVGEIDEGIGAYGAIAPSSVRFFEDGWFKVGKALWLREDYEGVRRHFGEFVGRFPGSARVAEAVYQIGRTFIHAGDLESARERYWAALRELGDNPEAHAVEDILTALPRVYQDSGSARNAVARDLDALRYEAQEQGKKTLELRCLWAKATVLAPVAPELAQSVLLQAGSHVDPAIHNPRLSIDCADARRHTGHVEVAKRLYRDTRRWHPRTPERDRVAFGLAAIAAGEGDRTAAVELYGRCADQSFRPSLRAAALMAKAELEAAIGAPTQARATLEEMLGDPAAPSRTKAEGLLSYGALVEAEGQRKKALAYYERVYLTYGKHPDLVADAYWRRGRTLEAMALEDEAVEVYLELVGRDDLGGFEVASLARGRLEALAAGHGGAPPSPAAPPEGGL